MKTARWGIPRSRRFRETWQFKGYSLRKVRNLRSLLTKSEDLCGAVRPNKVTNLKDRSLRSISSFFPKDLKKSNTRETCQVCEYLGSDDLRLKIPFGSYETKG